MLKRLTLPLVGLVLVAGTLFVFRGYQRAHEALPLRTVAMSMREYTFNEANPTFQFQPGERIRFVVTNDEPTNVLHNFRVVGLDVECGPPMVPGERREVVVTMPKSGEFAYTCCTHPGMGGKMVVAKE